MHQPKVLVIQDISASCRISLNVAVPVLSCLNNGVSVLPTALLSTHTGIGFTDFTYLNLTSEIKKILHHWKTLGLKFDGLLIGYLGSIEQIALVRYIIREFLTDDALSVLDPVLGDHGFLYPGFDDDYVNQMRILCRDVSVVIPNMTETSLLLDESYHPGPYTEADIKAQLRKLTALNQGTVVLTGVRYDDEKIGAASYRYQTDGYAYAAGPYYPGHFDGTGDLFSSVIAGFLFQKKPLALATKTAVDYVGRVIVRTLESDNDLKYGVQFETDLPYLIQQLYQDRE